MIAMLAGLSGSSGEPERGVIMTGKEAIDVILRHMLIGSELVCDALDITISTLQEQEERGRGCEYCQQFDDPCSAPMIAVEESDTDRGIYLYNDFRCANGGEFCEAEINFCPMCGRRLHLPKPTPQKSNN